MWANKIVLAAHLLTLLLMTFTIKPTTLIFVKVLNEEYR